MSNPINDAFSTLKGADPRSLDFLAKALSNNNLPGFDYLEFKEAFQKLKALGIDDGQAIQSAFVTATTVGLTRSKLIDTAKYYKNIIEQERSKFTAALQTQIQTKVESRRTEVAKLQDQIKHNKELIQRLEEENTNYLKQVEQAQEEMQVEEAKLNNFEGDFDVTIQAVTQDIDADIVLIEEHLKN